MKTFKEKLFEYYNLDETSFKNLTKELIEADFLNIYNYKNIKEISQFIKDEIANNKKILIYGDYDCDGIMSICIMYLTLKKLGITPGFYIPFREIDGYGINKERINCFKKLKYDTISLVDNGITLCEEVDLIHDLGMKVVIIDHHTIKEKVPNTPYILHPMVSNIGEYNASAGALCFYLSYVMLNQVDEYLLSLGGISIISDMMPLVSYNRTLLRHALKAINKNKFYQIQKLVNFKNEITENDIGMKIAPKVNAIGRIVTDNKLFNVVKFFIETDVKKIDYYADFIESTNLKRQNLVEEVSQDLKSKISEDLAFIILVLDIKEGLTGLIANKLLQIYNKPTLILTNDKENNLKGSIRSKHGLNVFNLLEENSSLFIAYGGHELAGGITTSKENLDKIKEIFNNYAKEHPFTEERIKGIDITIDDVNETNYSIIKELSPFGQDFNVPLFKLNNFNTNFFKFSYDKNHIITNLSFNSSLVYFSFDKEILNNKFVNLIGTIDENVFNGKKTIQFKVKSYEKI